MSTPMSNRASSIGSPGPGQHRLVLHGREEPPVQRGITDQRRVEPGVEQHPAAVGLQQHAGHRFPHPLVLGCAVHRHRLGQFLPAQGQQDDASDLALSDQVHGVYPTDSAASRSEFGLVTTCACSTPLSHGWATMKSSTSAMLSQQPVLTASRPACEKSVGRTGGQALGQRVGDRRRRATQVVQAAVARPTRCDPRCRATGRPAMP